MRMFAIGLMLTWLMLVGSLGAALIWALVLRHKIDVMALFFAVVSAGARG